MQQPDGAPSHYQQHHQYHSGPYLETESNSDRAGGPSLELSEDVGGSAAPFRLFRANSTGGTALASPMSAHENDAVCLKQGDHNQQQHNHNDILYAGGDRVRSYGGGAAEDGGNGAGTAGSGKDAPPTTEDVSLVAMVLLTVFWALRVLSYVAALSGGIALLASIQGMPFARCTLLMSIGVGAVAYGGCMLLYAAGAAAYSAWAYRAPSAVALPARRIDWAATTCKAKVLYGCGYIVLPFVLLLVAVGLSIVSYFMFSMSQQLPDLNEDHGGAAVYLRNGSVRLWRDAGGLLYVEANSQHDAFFGQGYAHAQDRLWQMEFMRLAAKGALAAHLGSAALDFDKQTRTLGFMQAAQLMYNSASAASKSLMQSYVDGINFYLSTDTKRPPEFLFMSTKLLFFHQPQPFTPLDVCYAAKVLQWQLSLNAANEAERFLIFWNTERSYDEVEELYQNQTNVSHTIVSSEDLQLTEADCVAGRAREATDRRVEKSLYDTYMTELRDAHNPTGRIAPTASRHFSTLADAEGGVGAGTGRGWGEGAQRPLAGVNEDEPPKQTGGKRKAKKKKLDLRSLRGRHASNAWSGRAAGATTQPCGASDPHLGIDLPSVWYWSNLSYPDANGAPFYTSGVGMTGIPGVHIAQTSYVSWGITMTLSDLEDLFLLVPDPANPDTHYMVNGTSTAFTYRTEEIEVYGADNVVLNVKVSIYGPVASDAFDLPSPLQFAAGGRPLENDTTSADAFLAFSDPSIHTVEQFRDRVLAYFDAPGLSIASQDSAGTVAWAMTGRHYIRAVGHTGKYPTLGNGSFDYRGDIAYADLPAVTKPASATEATFVSCANQKIAPDGYAYTLGYDYDFPWRGARIQTMLAEDASALSTVARHQAIQCDLKSNIWTWDFVPFLNSTTSAEATAFRSLLTTAGTAMLQQLLNVWDGDSTRGSRDATRFYWFMRELMSLPRDAIAVLRNLDISDTSYWNPQGLYQVKLFWNPSPLMLQQCHARWQRTNASALPAAANWCVVFAAEAFNAIAEVEAGSVPQWGVDANAVVGEHLMLTETILSCLFERADFRPGDMSTVNVADFSYRQDGAFRSLYASSMRQIYDWGDRTMRFSIPGGNSGNPYSNYYQTFWDAWFANQYTWLGGGHATQASSQTLYD